MVGFSVVVLAVVTTFLVVEVGISLSSEVHQGVIVLNRSQFMFFIREIQLRDASTGKVFTCNYAGISSNDYEVGRNVVYKRGNSLAVIPSLLPNVVFPPIVLDGLCLFALMKLLIDVMHERRLFTTRKKGRS